MRKVMVFLFSASLFWVSCGPSTNNQAEETSMEVAESKDSIIENAGLIEWAIFFNHFSESLKDQKKTTELLLIPFNFFGQEFKNEKSLNEENFSIYFPQTFIDACQQVNKELGKELQYFETNKFYKYLNSESGHYKLLIDYKEDEVEVTHFRHIPKTKGQFEQIQYTFSKLKDGYKLISITQ